MSANIHWRPVAKSNKSLNVATPSAFQDKMREAGLPLPCTVEQRHIDLIRGMAIGYGAVHHAERPNPFQHILDLLEHHEAIEIWAVY